MQRAFSYRIAAFLVEVLLILAGLLFLVPFYFLLVNSVKTFGEILTHAAAWPTAFHFSNYAAAWESIDFPSAFGNSLLVTLVSNVLLLLISSMAAYQMVRNNTLFNRILFGLIVSAMVIPFQSIMLPLMEISNMLSLNNSIAGLILCYLGFGAPLSVFLFHGFIKTVPLEIEQAARVDGSNRYGVFFRVVLPLLQPMMITVLILNTLWIWNDYLLPSLILTYPDKRTIPIATYTLFGQYTKQWDLALPALVLGILPIVIFFLALQKYIVSGIAAGAVKG
ncbi:carbohydrate ABC transporter permease [Paenibacillus sp. P96]|uniref:Carbohydrate ABC transporter permease n=1 Tax=Paenibacillus zeirhizosphaerae TaxID=2987519 RepID=A0ABT9FNM0_9BACL|nr:carbohydrate ABC transporter permease [Paenibacillus sp. P96]MDP4096101.1 carbohydrate ABC transporter permease [Paenibacillus sp. P96]